MTLQEAQKINRPIGQKLSFEAGSMITAMATPFKENAEEGIDFESLEKLTRHLLDTGSTGLLVCGTTGESPTLTTEEKIALFKAVKEVVILYQETTEKHIPIIMGVGTNCTRTTIENAKIAQKNGADAILVVNPYYNKPTQEGLFQHFYSVAMSVPKMPVLLYNIPSRTGIETQPETIIQLAKVCPNIIGVKQCVADLSKIDTIKRNTPAKFEVYSGDDDKTLEMMSHGAKGVVSVASHLVGKTMKRMIEAYQKKDFETAQVLYQCLKPIFENLFIETNPIPVKAGLAHKKIISYDSMRLPLVPMSGQNRPKLFRLLDAMQHQKS